MLILKNGSRNYFDNNVFAGAKLSDQKCNILFAQGNEQRLPSAMESHFNLLG